MSPPEHSRGKTVERSGPLLRTYTGKCPGSCSEFEMPEREDAAPYILSEIVAENRQGALGPLSAAIAPLIAL